VKRLLLLLALLLFGAAAAAQVARPLAEDEAVERRVNAIAEELRCLVCQNESIAGSRADLAVDLRRQIREQIKAGRSDDQILAYMTDRYGDFIRYRPPLKGTTVALWAGPFVLLAVAAGGLAWYVRRRRARTTAAVLSREEEARVARLLADAGDDRPA
jgi:cytochrome c-type biogenesis protein CcmH